MRCFTLTATALLLFGCKAEPKDAYPSLGLVSMENRVRRVARGYENLGGAVDSVTALSHELSSWPQARGAHPGEVAVAVYRESRRVGLDPYLVLAVMRVENPWLVPDTVSYAGAVGLLQVIPRYWTGVFPECGVDLESIEDNVCVGARVLHHYIQREKRAAIRAALLAYNGCLGGHCRNYATLVMNGTDQ